VIALAISTGFEIASTPTQAAIDYQLLALCLPCLAYGFMLYVFSYWLSTSQAALYKKQMLIG
jgi:hypothetical protein